MTDPARSCGPAAVDATGADRDTAGADRDAIEADADTTGAGMTGAGMLVVGYGSALRSDDTAGRYVAEAIERRALPGVTVSTPTQLVPELAELIARATRVVFVDASVAVGDVTVRRLTRARLRPARTTRRPTDCSDWSPRSRSPARRRSSSRSPSSICASAKRCSATTALAVDRAVDEVMALLQSSG